MRCRERGKQDGTTKFANMHAGSCEITPSTRINLDQRESFFLWVVCNNTRRLLVW